MNERIRHYVNESVGGVVNALWSVLKHAEGER